MPWTKWALVPKGVVGKTKHYWGMPAELAPDARRVDMPPARILLIDQDDESGADVSREPPEEMKRAMEKLMAEFEARGTEVIRQESSSEGVGLYRYAEDGEFAGDSECQTFEAATEVANWEYGCSLEWHDVPSSLRDASIDRDVIEKLLDTLPN